MILRSGFFFLVMIWGISVFAWAEEDKPFLFSPLAEVPEWRLLDSYQGTITRQEFQERARRIFDPSGALEKVYDD